jgi:enoyl-CoA hydratase/carnithine racemase
MSEPSSGQRVTVQITDGVADVRLARPEKRNALDPAMFAALVRTGEGPDFCAGLDFGSFTAMRDGGRLSATADVPPSDGPAKATGQRTAHAWTALPVPVIAAVTGNALGCRSRWARTSGSSRRTPCCRSSRSGGA